MKRANVTQDSALAPSSNNAVFADALGSATLHNFKLEKPCRFCRKDRRGAALVEFAIVSPVLFLMVFGMIEYGRMVMIQQVLTNAAREGARQAVLDGATNAGVNSYVSTYLTGAGIPSAAVQNITMVPNDPSTAAYGASIAVTVSVAFNKVTWLPTPIWLGGKTVSATATMRRESAQ